MEKIHTLNLEAFGDDYNAKYNHIKDFVNPPTIMNLEKIIEELNMTLCLIEMEEIKGDHKDKFLNLHLPQIVKLIFSYSYAQTYQAVFRKLNAFICCWLSRRLKFFPEHQPGDALIFRRIFSPKKSYYMVSFYTIHEDLALKEMIYDIENSGIFAESKTSFDCPWAWSKISKHFTVNTIPFHINVYCFAKLGGFNIIKELFENELLPESLKFHTCALKAVSRMVPCLNYEQWFQSVFPIFNLALKCAWRFLEDIEWKKLDQKQLRRYVENLNALAGDRYNTPTTNITERISKLRVKIAEKMVNESFNSTGILEIINLVTSQKTFPKDLLNWMIKGEVLNKLLVPEKLTPVVLRKCMETNFFGQLYSWQSLSWEHFTKLWDLSVDSNGDPDIKRGVSGTLVKLISMLNTADTSKVFSKLRETALLDTTEEIVNIISALIEKEFIGKIDPPVVLQYLFSLTHDTAIYAGLKPSVHQVALEKFIGHIPKMPSQIMSSYMLQCVEMLERDDSIVQAHKILSKAIEEQGTDKIKEKIRESSIAEKLVINAVKLKLATVKMTGEIISKSEASQEDIYETLVTSKALGLTYYKELNERFTILQSLLRVVPESLTSELLKILYKAFVYNNVSAKERDILFMLVEKLTSAKAINLFSPKLFEEFFYDVLLRLDPALYTNSAFACFKNLFICYNSYYKHLEVKGESFEVVHTKLLGLTRLWEVSFASPDEVNKLATEFLFEIYQHFTPEVVKREGKKIRDEFIEKCMDHLKSPPLAGRSIDLLARYMDCFEVKNGTTTKKYRHGTGISIIVHWFASSIVWEFRVTVKSATDTVESLLKQIIFKSHTDYSISKLCFISTPGILKPTSQNVSQIGLKDGSEILVEPAKRNTMARLKEMFAEKSDQLLRTILIQAKGDVSQAAELLSNENNLQEIEKKLKEETQQWLAKMYDGVAEPMSTILTSNSDLFFHLHSCLDSPSEETRTKAAAFLKKLPFSKSMLESMSIRLLTIKEPIQWNKIFPKASLPALNYALDTLSYILTSTFGGDFIGSASSDKILEYDQINKWLEVFIGKGGYEHLMNLLLGMDWEVNLSCAKSLMLTIREITLQALLGRNKSQVKKFLAQMSREKIDHYLVNSKMYRLNIFLHKRLTDEIKDVLKKCGIVRNLLKLFQKCANNEVRIDIIEDILLLLGAALAEDGNLYEEVYADKPFFELCTNTLMIYPHAELKTLVYNFLTGIFTAFPGSSTVTSPACHFLNVMLELFPAPTQSCTHSEKYFDLLIDLLPLLSSPTATYDPPQLAKKISEFIVQRLELYKEETADRLLAGYIMLLSQLIKQNYELILSVRNTVEVLCDCLYFSGTFTSKNKLNYKPVVLNLLNLLLECSRSSPEVRGFVLKRMCAFHQEQVQVPIKDPIYDLTAAEREQRFVGLKNLGATCYINAILQQFFMMPDFKAHLLSLPLESLPIKDCDKVLQNLQKIFSYLLLSEKQYYAPTEFCNDFIWDNHRPIDTATQHDADEFFNILTDKLEKELKILNKDKLIRNFMQVTVLHEIESLEPDKKYKTTTEEPCLTLSIAIKNKSTLEDALDHLLKGDIMDGINKYHCPEYNTEIKASKRCIIKSISKTLIIHLERFDFNNTTGTRKKLNDYCSFPFTLDFSKWTKDPKGPLLYELVGVLVHSGTAEGGHYVSIIKDRNDKSATHGTWFEFNDTHVRQFNISEMPKYFGKNNLKSNPEMTTGLLENWEIHEGNAYLLVYQKMNAESPAILNGESLTELVPEKYKKVIKCENLANMKGAKYIDQVYANFVKDFASIYQTIPVHTSLWECPLDKVCEESQSVAIHKLLFLYAFDYFMKAKEPKLVKDFTQILLPVIEQERAFSEWILKHLTENKTVLFESLIESRFNSAHIDTYKFLCACFNAITAETMISFTNLLLSEGFGHARAHFGRFDQFFRTLLHLTKLKSGAEILVQGKAIGKLIDFVANTKTSLLEKSGERPKMSEMHVNFAEPLNLLATLLKYTATAEMIEKKTSPWTTEIDRLLETPLEEVLLVFSQKWNFTSLAAHGIRNLTDILTHLCWESMDRTKTAFMQLIKGIEANVMHMEYIKLLLVLKDLILIKDSYFKERIRLAFLGIKVSDYRPNLIDTVRNSKDTLEELAVNVLYLLAELCREKELLEVAKKHLIEKLLWVPRYLETNPGSFRIMGISSTFNAEMQQKRDTIAKVLGEPIKEKAAEVMANDKENVEVSQNCPDKILPWEEEPHQKSNQNNQIENTKEDFELKEIKVIKEKPPKRNVAQKHTKEEEKAKTLREVSKEYKILVTNERREKVMLINTPENLLPEMNIKMKGEVDIKMVKGLIETKQKKVIKGIPAIDPQKNVAGITSAEETIIMQKIDSNATETKGNETSSLNQSDKEPPNYGTV